MESTLTSTREKLSTVLGRSGTGKSVLLKLIIGLQKPDSGSIRIKGSEVTSMKTDQLDEIRKKIGFLFQYSALYDSLTVEENVAFPLRRHTRMPENERREQGAGTAGTGGNGRGLGEDARGNLGRNEETCRVGASSCDGA